MKKFFASFTLIPFMGNLVLGNIALNLGTIQTAHAMAVPTCSTSIDGGYSGFLGEAFSFNVSLNNAGGTGPGFSPVTELVFPPQVTFNNANYSGVSVSPTLAQVVTDNDGGDVDTGTITSPFTGNDLVLNVGTNYVALEYPLGSHVPTQGPAVMTINSTLAGGLDTGVPLGEGISSRCGYKLGSDALDNPLVDPPLTTIFSEASVTPSVMNPSKTFSSQYGGGEGENTTGPNYPLQYTLSGDIANTATVTNITFNDSLNDALNLVSVDAVSDQGNGFTITFTPGNGDPVQTSSSVPFTVTGTPGPGGSLSVVLNSATGTNANSDVAVTYSAYVGELDRLSNPVINPSVGSSTNVMNTVSTTGTYNGSPISGNDSHNHSAKSIAIQKSSSVFTNNGPAQSSPGDRIQYTLNVQVSDYFSFDELVVEDILPDGMTFVPGSSAMTVIEDGAAGVPVTFTESVVSEANVILGPSPYDFSACAGCTLAVTADTTNDDDAIATPDDGDTVLTFDISGAMDGVGGLDDTLSGGINGDSTLTLTFLADINDTFIDSQVFDSSIDAFDTLINNATVSGQLATNPGTYVTDSTSDSIQIPEPTFSKNIVAFTDSFGNLEAAPFAGGQANISSGAIATYAFTTTIPAGDLEDLEITDFLPIPFFDADEITGFDAASVNTPFTPTDGDINSVPAAGLVAWGSNTSGFTGAFPTPTIPAPNSAENSFEIDFTDQVTFDETASDGITIELLFTVTASPQPMADGLKIVNQAFFSANDSNNTGVVQENQVVEIFTSAPSLNLSKGVVASDNSNIIFTNNPGTLTTWSAPGSSPAFTAPFSAAELAANAINSDASTLNGADIVTFATIIENEGTAAAYDVTLTDTFDNLFGTTFEVPAGGLNLQVFDANGNDLGAATTGGLFGEIVVGGSTDGSGDNAIVIAGPINYDRVDTQEGSANEGENIIVVTYDLAINNGVQPSSTITNTATVTNFASVSSGPDFTTTDLTDEAQVVLEDPSMTKTATASDQAFTALPDLTIGEEVTYTLEFTFPEGSSSEFRLTDNIPAGLAFNLDDGVTVDTTATCSGDVFNGTIPAFTIASPVGAGLATSGADLELSFNSDLIVNDDAIDTNNTFCLRYNATVLDIGSNDGLPTGSTSLNNSAVLNYHPDDLNVTDNASVNVVEPDVRVIKTAGTTSGDAGDTITYTIEVDHRNNSSADAFDLVVTDLIPSDLTYAGNVQLVSGTLPTVDATGDPTITFSFANLTLAQDSHVFTFDTTVNNTVGPEDVITNVANFVYDSIPGANANQRGGTGNNNANFTVNALALTKSITSTSEAHTGTAEHDATDTDLAIGESLTYQLVLTVPEGTTTNAIITDPLPNNFEITGAPTFTIDTNLVLTNTPPLVTLSDNGGDDGFNDQVVIDFGTITNNPDGDLAGETIEIEFPALVRNTSGTNGANVNNTATVSHATGSNVNATVNADIVEPNLAITKTVSDANPDAGDVITYTITLDHTATSTADAFDLVVTDILPAGLSYIGNVANTVGPMPTVDAAGDPTITFSFDDLTVINDSYAFTFQAQVDDTVQPNQTITNTAALTYDSLPADDDPQERDYNANANRDIVIEDISFTKTILNTSEAHTGTSQHDGADADIAIGESLTYRLTLTLPEGNANTVVVTDALPDNLEVTGAPTFAIDPNLVLTNTPPLVTLSDNGGDDGFNDQVVIDFGDITNAPDGDMTGETIEIDVPVLVRNTSGSNGADVNNTAIASYASGANKEDTANTDIVEPNLNITKVVDNASPDAGDIITYTITVDHTGSSTADAFDLVVTDTLPAGLSYVGNVANTVGPMPTVNATGDPTITFSYDDLTLANDNYQFTFQAQVNNDVAPNQTITNTVQLAYDSLPADGAAQERDYTDSANRNITITALSVNKTVLSPVGSLSFNPVFVDVAPGAVVTYRLSLAVPESDFTNLVFTDNLPAHFEALTGTLIQDDGISHQFTAATLSDTNADTINDRVVFDFGNVVNAPDADNETLILEVTALVRETVTAGTPFTNNVSVDYDENPSAALTDSASVDVVEPSINLTKTVDVNSGDAGDRLVYTLTANNTGTGTAHDIVISDIISGNLNVDTAFDSDGLDNDGDGSTDEVDELANTYFNNVTDTFTWNNANTGGAHFTALAPAASFTLQFAATVDSSAELGTLINNQADVTYNSSPGAPTGSKSYNGDDNVDFSVNSGSIGKTINGPQTDYQIGSNIPYRITITMTEGLSDPVIITDTIPAGLAYVPDSLSITTNNDPQISLANTLTNPTNANPTSDAITVGQSQALTFNLGAVNNTNTNNATAEEIYLDYEVVVLNTSDNAQGNTKTNSASVDFGGNASSGPVLAPNATIVEPSISVSKTNTYTTGDTVTYQFEIENNAVSSQASAYDVVITDTLPVGLAYLGNEVYTNVPTAPAVSQNGQTITFTFSEVPNTFNNANPVTFTYQAQIEATATAGSNLINNAALTFNSHSGNLTAVIPANALNAERTGNPADNGGAENDFNTTSQSSITVNRPDLSTSNKSFVDNNGGNVEIGDTLTYTINVINTGNAAATGIDVIDHIPDHVNSFTVTTPPATGVDNSQTAPAGNNQTGLLNFTGITLDAAGGADTVTIEYQVVVSPSLLPDTGIQNSLIVTPATEGGPGATDQVNTSANAPLIALSKVASVPTVQEGNTIDYTVTITNNGNADATNLIIQDVMPTLLNFNAGSARLNATAISDALDVDSGDYGQTNPNSLTVTIPILSAGNNASITYQVTANSVSNSQNAVNIVSAIDDQGSNVSTQATVQINPIPVVARVISNPPGGSGGGGSNACRNCSRATVMENPRGITGGGIPRNPSPRTVIPPTPTPDDGYETYLKEQKEQQELLAFMEKTRTITPIAETETFMSAAPQAPMPNDIPGIFKRLKDDLSRLQVYPKTGQTVLERVQAVYGGESVFEDVNMNHPYYEAGLILSLQGLVDTPTEEIKLDENITRAEALQIMTKALGIYVNPEPATLTYFHDVPQEAPLANFTNALKELGLGNDAAKEFNAEENLNYETFLLWLVRFSDGFVNDVERELTDGWGTVYADALKRRNLVPEPMLSQANWGYELTRGEFYEMVYRSAQRLDSNEDVYTEKVYFSAPELGIENVPTERSLISQPSSWLKSLANGAAFYEDVRPDQNNRYIVFAHSSKWSFDNTLYGFIFRPFIKQSSIGKEVEITKHGETKKYRIVSEAYVEESMVETAKNVESDIDLLIFTCGTDVDFRHIYKAKLIE